MTLAMRVFLKLLKKPNEIFFFYILEEDREEDNELMQGETEDNESYNFIYILLNKLDLQVFSFI